MIAKVGAVETVPPAGIELVAAVKLVGEAEVGIEGSDKRHVVGGLLCKSLM